jgi:hypothetical protein
MQPGQGALDNPAGPAQTAAMWSPALGELRGDAAVRELVSMRLRIVAAVALDQSGFAHRPAGTSAERRHGVDER